MPTETNESSIATYGAEAFKDSIDFGQGQAQQYTSYTSLFETWDAEPFPAWVWESLQPHFGNELPASGKAEWS